MRFRSSVFNQHPLQEFIMLSKIILASSSLFLSSLVVGCALGAGASARPADEVMVAGMTCPKCETVWVTQVTDQGLKTQRLASERKMTCPDCDTSATAALQEGKSTPHNCPTCQVTLTPVKPAKIASPRGPRSF
jgi:hypothetical protein